MISKTWRSSRGWPHFRFVGAVAADGPFLANGETGAVAADFTTLGFRISRLPRRFSLAIFSPLAVWPRPAPLPELCELRHAQFRNARQIYWHECLRDKGVTASSIAI